MPLARSPALPRELQDRERGASSATRSVAIGGATIVPWQDPGWAVAHDSEAATVGMERKPYVATT